MKLEFMITEVREDIRRNEKKRQKIEIDLARIEQSAKAAPKRLDLLETVLKSHSIDMREMRYKEGE